MAFSQNGFSANDTSQMTTVRVPGGSLMVRKGDTTVVFAWLAARFNAEVEKLAWPGCWGYAARPIRGGTTLSNHASGTAVDFNAPRHPLGAAGTFTRTQVAAIRRILADADGVLRWGGDYRGRKDEMHFEINAGGAAVARLARKIQEEDMPLSDADVAKVADAVWRKQIPKYGNANTESAQAQLGKAMIYGYRLQPLLDTEKLAAQIAANIPAGAVTQTTIEAAIRAVLGSLDQED